MAALILTLSDAARIESDVITSFKHIQAIDWKDGDSSVTEVKRRDDEQERVSENHSGPSSFTVDPENITSIEFDDPAVLQDEKLDLRSQSVTDNTTAISTSDWDNNSSHVTNNQTNAINSSLEQENNKKQVSVSNHSEVTERPSDDTKGQQIRPPSLTDNTSDKNTKTDTSLAEDSSNSENKDESNVILSALDVDDFIPFTPGTDEQTIQPVLTTKEPNANSINRKERRSRSKIKTIEISGVITPRPSKRSNNTLSHNPLRAKKKTSVEVQTSQPTQNSWDSRLNDTAAVTNDSLSSTLNKDVQHANKNDSDDTIASAATILDDISKQPIVSDASHDPNAIPAAYMWHPYVVPLDPAEILANDSVVSMFDFINISNSTESDLEDGDTLFLPYGIIDTPYPFPVMMTNETNRQDESSSNPVPQRDDDLHVEGSNPFISFYKPIIDQVPEGSSLSVDRAHLPPQKRIRATVAPHSFAEFAVSYARALKHDDTSKRSPEKQRQSFRVFSADEHDRAPAAEKQKQSRERAQPIPLPPNGVDNRTDHPFGQKTVHDSPSQNVTGHHHAHTDTSHGKYETRSETAFHHFNTASVPLGFAEVPPYYSYKYDVDGLRGHYFGHEEVKDLLKTRGKYFVLLPDGRLQTVTYYANRTGYYPHVVYNDLAAHPDFGHFKHILIPKYPSNPSIIGSTHSIVTPAPVIHHSATSSLITTLSPIPLTVSPFPDVKHKLNHFPVPQQYDEEQLYIPDYLSRHWFHTLRAPATINRPFPSIEHLHHGHAMPLLKPFHPAFATEPHHHLNSVQITKAKVENVNDRIHLTTTSIPHLPVSPSVLITSPTPLSSPLTTSPILISPTTNPLPPPLLTSPPIPASTPKPPLLPTSSPILISQRPLLPPVPLTPPPIKTPTPTTSLPLPPFPTSPSILVTPKSAPRPLPLPNKAGPSVTPPTYPASSKVAVLHHHTTSLPPHSQFLVTTPVPPYPTLRPTPLPPPISSPFIPRPLLKIPLTAGTRQPVHSVLTPYPNANPLYSHLPYHIPGLSNLLLFSRGLPIIHTEPLAPMRLHQIWPFHPVRFHSQLHPGEIPTDHQPIGYLNAEHMILTNPRIQFFYPYEHKQARPHPVQTSLASTVHSTFYFPDNSPFHRSQSLAPKATPASHSQRDKNAPELPKPYPSNPVSNQSLPIPPHSNPKPALSYPKPNLSDPKLYTTSPKPDLSDSKPYKSDPKPYNSDPEPYSPDSKPYNSNTKPYNSDLKRYHSDTTTEQTYRDNKATSQKTSVLDELAEYDEAAKEYL